MRADDNDDGLTRSMSDPDDFFDVGIVGGGPAGSVAAAHLARNGVRVVVLEKDSFPRFRIGESLLPNGNDVLRRIGVWEKVESAGFVRKFGAEFTVASGERTVHNLFARGLVRGLDYTYQVERSRFDSLLLEHARESGAVVYMETAVRTAEETPDGWRLTATGGEGERTIAARWLIDASGRDAFLGRQRGLAREAMPYPKRMAIYNHFSGVARKTGPEGGNIIIVRLEDGWFWVIPLSDGKTSMGLVTAKALVEGRRAPPAEVFQRAVEESSLLREITAAAEPVDRYRVTADYCYGHESYAGQRYFLVGDAAGFVDPVFSSGVYLALRSGLLAADTIIQKLRSGAVVLSEREQRRFTRGLKRQTRTIRRLIETFYDNAAIAVFMSEGAPLKMDAAVNSIVGGVTNPPFRVRWRFWLFRLVCRWNRGYRLVPRAPLSGSIGAEGSMPDNEAERMGS